MSAAWAAAAGGRAQASVVLGHGAGNDMDSGFMRDAFSGLVRRGCACLRFNFLYKETGRKIPDPRPKLEAAFRAAAGFAGDRLGSAPLILGGKSMGGRIASHVAATGLPAAGLLFFGYPLHPPGKPEALRDAHLYSIGCPMLFLSGTRDPFATPALLEGVVGRIGGAATLHWIEGGDHSLRVRGKPPRETLDSVLDTAVAWIERLPAQAGRPEPGKTPA